MLVFIDESGDHAMSQQNIDPKYPVFVLVGLIFDEESYGHFDIRFKTLKKELFGTDQFIVHTAEITRPNKAKDQRSLKFNNADFRKKFYNEVDKIISESDYEIIACAIHKDKLASKENPLPNDPYITSFNSILERLMEIKQDNQFSIYPEKRGHNEDTKLELAFLRAKVAGTGRHKGATVSEKIKLFELVSKEQNMSGSQFADLIATPIGRYEMRKSKKPEGNELNIDSILAKIKPGNYIIQS